MREGGGDRGGQVLQGKSGGRPGKRKERKEKRR